MESSFTIRAGSVVSYFLYKIRYGQYRLVIGVDLALTEVMHITPLSASGGNPERTKTNFSEDDGLCIVTCRFDSRVGAS